MKKLEPLEKDKQDDARKMVKALKLESGTLVEDLVRMALMGKQDIEIGKVLIGRSLRCYESKRNKS